MNAGAVVTVIQARTGSTRLPGKVLLPLAGAPALARVVERVRAASLSGTVVVATTTEREDDAIVALCEERGFGWFRGDPLDLLDRHVRTARAFGADHVVKIPSDCPLIDPACVDRVLGYYLSMPGSFDYVGNLHPQSWPDGNDVEVMPVRVLERAAREARRPMDREHTTPYLWDNPGLFRIGNVVWETGRDESRRVRLTLDYPEDYALIAAVYNALYPANPRFSVGDILDFLAAHPGVADLNACHRGVNWYRHHLDTLNTVGAADTRFPETA